jgi:hypothetical protein
MGPEPKFYVEPAETTALATKGSSSYQNVGGVRLNTRFNIVSRLTTVELHTHSLVRRQDVALK